METISTLFNQGWFFFTENLLFCLLVFWCVAISVITGILAYKNNNLKWRKECLEDYIDQVEEEDIPGFEQRIEILKEDLKIAKNQRDCAQGKLGAFDKRAFCIEQAIMITNQDLSFKEAFKQVSACLNGKS